MQKEYIKKIGEYWNKRFKSENHVWGEKSSKTAEYALKLFQNKNITSILVPGSGYGRNTKTFSSNGFEVTGIEISEKAYNLAKRFDKKTNFYNGNVMDIPFDQNIYNAIYCFNLLHLFRKNERKEFISKCKNKIQDDGFLFFTVFSIKEKSYDKGKEVEKNTFESKPGRPVHYYTKDDLINEFNEFKLIETDIIKDPENHGDTGFHIHNLRYIFIQKS